MKDRAFAILTVVTVMSLLMVVILIPAREKDSNPASLNYGYRMCDFDSNKCAPYAARFHSLEACRSYLDRDCHLGFRCECNKL